MSRVPSNPAYHAGGHHQHPHQHPHPHMQQQHPGHQVQYQHPHSQPHHQQQQPQHAPHHPGAPPPSAPLYYASHPSDHPLTSPSHPPPTSTAGQYPPLSAHSGHGHGHGPSQGQGYDGQYGYRHEEAWRPASGVGSGGHSAPGSATAPAAHAYPPHGHASSSRHPDPYSYSQPNGSLAGPSHPPPPPHGANGHAPPATSAGTSSTRLTSPSGRPATSSAPRQPPGSTGWTSVHPHQPTQKGGRSASGPSAPGAGAGPTGGDRVKMEELVSSDPPRSASGKQSVPKLSNTVPSGAPAGTGPPSAPLLTGNLIPPGLPPAIAALHAPGGPFDPATNPAPTQQPGPSEFIKKLYKMLEEESAMYGGGESSKTRPKGAKRGSVGWGRGGTTFVVWDMNDFTTKILPQTFRHSNFSSFVRQLNKYGFSKIKHVDEDTGQMKENVWEFQHPNFQAGGKADLDSIKRKATVSKKDAEAMDPPSPGRVHPLNSHNSSLSNDDAMRFIHMEERLRLMEMDMISMGDELKEARNREVGMMGLMREMIGQIGQLEQATANTPRSTDDSPSQRIVYLYQMLDQITGSMHPGHGYGYGPSAMHPAYPSHPSHVHVGAPPRQGRQQHMPPPLQHQHSYTMQPPSALVSARTSDGSGSNNNPSPASNQSQSARMAPSQSQQQQQQQQQQAVLPSGSAGSSSNVALGQTQYGTGLEPTASNAGPAGTAATATEASQHPTFADTGAWLTENTNMPMPVYHRKSSDGQALRFMMDILTQQGGASQNQGGAGGTGADGRFTDTQDPLDTTARQSDMPQAPGLQVNYPIVQQSPFGTLLIPAESGIHPNALANAAANMSNGIGGYGNDSSAGVLGGNSNGNMSGQPSATLHELPSNGIHTAGPGLANGSASSSVPLPSSGEAEPVTFGQRSTTDAQGNTNRLRRSTLIKPSWNKTPRILVVEDDVVYRQLSSKFLEKFGCVVETVVNASEAIEKMNSTKYDLVLMDIFFGPSMDGRKATSLIRQFDMYTPIISMTSNAQPKDVDSYLQSGMNDILAKPFTKNGLFGILDKHLIHLKAIQLSGEVPRSVGVPPLSAEGFMDAMITSANMQLSWTNGNVTGNADDGDGEGQLVDLRNPLGGMGMSDDAYQILLHQFIQNGALPEGTNMQFTPYGSTPMPAQTAMITNTSINNSTTTNGVGVGVGVGGGGAGGMGGTIGTNLVFGNANRKRSLEMLDDDWSPTPGTTDVTPVLQQGAQVGMGLPVANGTVGGGAGSADGGAGVRKEVKKAKKA